MMGTSVEELRRETESIVTEWFDENFNVPFVRVGIGVTKFPAWREDVLAKLFHRLEGDVHAH